MTRASLPRIVLTSALSLIGFAGILIPTASAAQNRVLAPITNTGYVAIPSSTNPKVKLGTDLGPAPAGTPLPGMSIRFNMTEAQQAALDQLLANQQNPSSSQYHQWLTPAQFGAQFGLSSADLAKVTAWLKSQGFTVTGVANGGTFITFDGTVAQAQTAFSTSIHNISLNGETHFANVTNVSVPGAIGGVVAAVTGLHNFRLQPRVHTSIVKPNFTSSVSEEHYIAPGDIYTIYNSNPLLTAGMTGAGIGTGTNCHSANSLPCGDIAVTGQVDIYPADITAFRSASGLNTSILPTTIHDGADPGPPICNSCDTGPNEGDLAESSIDLEWSGAMAPAANILFVNATDVIPNAMSYAIDNDLAPIVTTSYGLCEAGWGYAELISLNLTFKQASAQGQTVLAAAADEGATDCDAGPSAEEGLNVDFPGSSPYVTSMGGSQFNEGNATGATTYWSGTNGSTGGSAISYIPEAVWNDEPAFDSFGGGGGGSSAFFTKPAWQVGTPADASRDVPDLALDASDAHDALLYCVNVAEGDSCTNGYRLSNNDLEVAGGTSFDSQIFGGLLALIEQKLGSKPLGNINPEIYALGNSKYYVAGATTLTNASVVFNDVTSGSNAMPCTAGSPDCPNGGQIGYNAGLGYDLATGWGSPNVANLAADWTLVTPLTLGTLGTNTSSTALTATPTSAAVGATVTLTATVSGSAGTPTGSVQFFADGTSLGTVPLTSSATATYSWVTSCSAMGQQVMTASYSGDSNYQGSKGPLLTANGAPETSNGSSEATATTVEVNVTSSTCPDFSVAPTAGTGVTVSGSTATVTVAAGGTIPAVTITASPLNGFAGTVVFSATATNSSGYAPTLTFSPASVSLSGSSAVTTTLTFSGITANLKMPNAPGQIDSGVMMAQHTSSKHPWYAAGSGVTIASLLLLVLPRRRRLGGLLAVALAIALIGGASGCGSSQPVVSSSGGGGTTTSNPYVGVYDVTVIGTYTSSNNQVTQHISTITYNIN